MNIPSIIRIESLLIPQGTATVWSVLLRCSLEAASARWLRGNPLRGSLEPRSRPIVSPKGR